MITKTQYDIYNIDFNQNFYTFTDNELYNFKNKLTEEEVSNLERLAEEIINYPLQSVTYDRPDLVKLYNKNDYFSLALYYWPNPLGSHLPYIQRDGIVYPESLKYAKLALRKMSFVINIASLMYYFTDNDKYYKILKGQLYNFFINKKTMMNPNLNHAQMIINDPINKDGRGIGIIDFGAATGYDFVILKNLYNHNKIEESLYVSLREWAKKFVLWLETSKNGMDEKKAKNNHGTMYTLLKCQLHYFIDDIDLYNKELLEELNLRINEQISEDGKMELELQRTRALSYTMMNIKGFIDCYKLLNIDYTKINKLKKAVDFITPYINGEKNITDLLIIDKKTNNVRNVIQIEGKYLNCFNLYIKYLFKDFGYVIKTRKTENVFYKYFL